MVRLSSCKLSAASLELLLALRLSTVVLLSPAPEVSPSLDRLLLLLLPAAFLVLLPVSPRPLNRESVTRW